MSNHSSKRPDATSPVHGLEHVKQRSGGRPPVESWNPSTVREIDMRIGADGTWYYLGTPILRPAMVQLFASILRREDDGQYALVTPVEKCLISVDDVPFLVTGMRVDGRNEAQSLQFETNIGDTVVASRDHPLRFATVDSAQKPYVMVRGQLEALLNRATAYELMALSQQHVRNGEDWYGVWSGGIFWPVMALADMGDVA